MVTMVVATLSCLIENSTKSLMLRMLETAWGPPLEPPLSALCCSQTQCREGKLGTVIEKEKSLSQCPLSPTLASSLGERAGCYEHVHHFSL